MSSEHDFSIGGNPLQLLNYQYAENVTPSSDSTGIYTEHLKLVTNVLVAGTYRIGWRSQFESSSSNVTGQVRLQVDDVITVDEEEIAPPVANKDTDFANFETVVLAAGIHEVDVDFRLFSGVGTFTIDDTKLEIWRVA